MYSVDICDLLIGVLHLKFQYIVPIHTHVLWHTKAY